jgi:type I restriction enzyme S subunit
MWRETTLGEHYDVRDGTHDSPKYIQDGFPLVTSKNLKNGKIDLTKVKYISKEDYEDINRRSGVSLGDVLMAMIGTIGNPVEIIEPPEFAIKNVALFKTNDEQSPAFLFYFLSHPHTISKMMADAKGATQKFVGLGYLRSFPILVPPLEVQEQIVEKLKAVYAEVENVNESILKIKTNYQTLKSATLTQELQPSEAA